MISESGEDESTRLKGVAGGDGFGREGANGGGLLSNPMPGQCIFCGKQFKNNEEKEKHENEVHKV
jgi:hypothetical protein